MPKKASLQYTFNVPWEHATTAFWCKYPNPDLQHVKDALVLDRTVDEKGRLRTTRIMCVQQPVPRVLQKLAGNSDTYYAVERSIVDPESKVLILDTQNITYDGVLSAKETCIYRAAEDGASTEYSWEVECGVQKHLPFIQDCVEEALVKKAKSNSAAGLAKMDELVQEAHHRAITNQKPRFMRWNTRRPTISENKAKNNHKTTDLYTSGYEQISNQTRQSPRRFLLFGPRKPFWESSFFPNQLYRTINA
mmetsp:Transcript_7099/g.14264  ORF Transcript_7099/g.14264 Transcript_7099/m.14264 type:complete len:249 (-) Transcript_7099:80-826(-)